MHSRINFPLPNHTSTSNDSISTVRQYYTVLLEINADDIIPGLYSKNVISRVERDEAIDIGLNSKKMHRIIQAVEGIPEKLQTFLTVLGEIPKYKDLAGKIQNSYDTGTSATSYNYSNVSLNKYADRLRSYYCNSKYSENDHWTWCPILSEYIELDMIEKCSSHVSNLDMIGSKLPVRPALKADGTLHKLVLVEGEAGIGKSTWAWNMCNRWAKHEIFEQIKLLVLMPLYRLCQVTDSEDLWKFYPGHTKEEIKELDKEAQNTNGRGIMFLFDGYEKYTAESQELIHKIIDGLCLPEAIIIVTTRPSRSVKWKHRVEQHIKILGFSKENARTYMAIVEDRTCISTSVMGDVEHLMTSPLNCNIIAYVCSCHNSCSNGKLLTMTQIYTFYIRSVIANHFLEKKEQLVKCESLDDLPEEIMQPLIKLSKLAYDGISQQKYCFNKLPDNCEPMDLMYHDLIENPDGPTRASAGSYCFKAIIQEYLAAFYMHKNNSSETMHQKQCGFSLVLQFFCGLEGTCALYADYPSSDDDCEEDGHSDNSESDDDDDEDNNNDDDKIFICDEDDKDPGNESISSIQYEGSDAALKNYLDYTIVDEEASSHVLNEIVQVKHCKSQKRDRDSEDEEDEYFRRIKKQPSRMSSLLDSSLDKTNCTEEQESLETLNSASVIDNNDSPSGSECEETYSMADDDIIFKKQTLLCLFETQNVQDLPHSVMYEETTKCLTPSDSFKLGYCIGQSDTKWKLHLSSANIIHGTLEAFAEGVGKGNSDGQIIELNLDDNRIEKFETLCSCIPEELLSSCREMSLASCFSSPPISAIRVADYLSSIKTLAYLDLSNNNLTDDKAEILIKSLISCKLIQSLKLRQTNLGAKSQHAICTLLTNAKTIHILDISSNIFDSMEGIKQLCTGINNSSSLRELDIRECFNSSKAETFFSTNVVHRPTLRIKSSNFE